MRNRLKLKPDTIRTLSTLSFVKNRIQSARFSKVKNYSGTEMAARRYPAQERMERLATVRKINLKRKDTAAVSKVKPSLLQHFQIKLMVV